MSTRVTRRSFLQAAAAGTAGSWAGRIAAAARNTPPSERLQVGVIGSGGQGETDWKQIAEAGADIAALCDVHESRAAKARSSYPNVPFYTDFRKLLEQKGLDAVLVATPDHTHAVATMSALRAGLHVYCEKPLTHTVHEARVVAEMAARNKRVTQMGIGVHAFSNYHRIVELIQSGAIGTVEEVHVWCRGSYGNFPKPKGPSPIPPGLHYDLWLGPAPERPYSPAFVPLKWRGWWDFGGGVLADMACHHMDLAFWALDLRSPTHIAAEGSPPDPDTVAVWLIVNYEFPARGELPPVRLTWYDGGKLPPAYASLIPDKWGGRGDGSLFVGSKGMVLATYREHRLLPEKEFKDFQPPKPFIPESVGHHREWVQACKTDGPTTCNFDYGGALTEAVLLGNVSYRLGKPFAWDSQNLKASEPDAERYLRTEYRKPWTL
jgi:predicted dehydrogenase